MSRLSPVLLLAVAALILFVLSWAVVAPGAASVSLVALTLVAMAALAFV